MSVGREIVGRRVSYSEDTFAMRSDRVCDRSIGVLTICTARMRGGSQMTELGDGQSLKWYVRCSWVVRQTRIAVPDLLTQPYGKFRGFTDSRIQSKLRPEDPRFNRNRDKIYHNQRPTFWPIQAQLWIRPLFSKQSSSPSHNK